MVDLIAAGLVLAMAGFGIIVISLLTEANKSGARVKGGGVVLVGPIPVIFGSDAKWASVAIALAIVLVVLLLTLYLV